MNSCLYEGSVLHARHAPVPHRFRFPLALLYLDLDEVDRVFGGRWLWSATRPAWLRFRREDHLGDPALPLAGAVRDCVEAKLGFRPAGPVRLLTSPRHLGFRMNPVSFFYCFDAEGRSLEALVAEVTNTPWDERHLYVLRLRDAARDGKALRAGCAKEFHVSPFLDMPLAYDWRIAPPGDELSLGLGVRAEDGRAVFDATLALERRELTSVNRARFFWRYPALTLQVFAGIYWQALRLFLAGVPVHPHPASNPQPSEARS